MSEPRDAFLIRNTASAPAPHVKDVVTLARRRGARRVLRAAAKGRPHQLHELEQRLVQLLKDGLTGCNQEQSKHHHKYDSIC